MRPHASALSPVLALLLPGLGLAAEDRPVVRPTVSRATHFTISCPVRDLAPTGSRTVEALGPVHSVDAPQMPEIPVSSTSAHADGALQDAAAAPAGGLPPILVSFAGLSNLDNLAEFGVEVIPASTNLAAGPNHLVQGTNFLFRVYDKAGNPLTAPFPISDLFVGAGGNCEQNDDGDPIVVYDPLADRWLITQFAFQSTTTPPYSLCAAVSQTADPTGAWYAYEFSTGNEFPNFPFWSAWPDAYYAAYTQFTNGTTFNGTAVIAVDRFAMLAGDPNVQLQNFDIGLIQPNLSGCQPTSHQGYATPPPGTPNLLWCPLFPASGMGVFEVDADFVDPTRSYAIEHPDSPIVVALHDRENPAGLDDIEQPPPATSGSYLDSGHSLLKHAVWFRASPGVQSYLMNYTVNVSGVAPTTPATYQAGIRWMELRRNASTGGVSLVQQATHAQGPGNGNGTNLWNGSTTFDAAGNIWLGYSRSSLTEFPSFDYAARRAADPPGTLLAPGTIQAGGGSQTTTGSRWGDYSSVTVDPADDCTIWKTNTHYPTSSNATWHTRIASSKFDDCVAAPTGTLDGRVTACQDGASLPGVRVTTADGRSATSGADGSYRLPLLPPGTYTVLVELEGFKSFSTQVTIVANQTRRLDPCLEFGTVTESITVTATPPGEESCAPPNGAADPGETVTADLCVTNNTGAPTANLTGVLYPTGGVVGTSGPRNYGVIIDGQTICREFTFFIDTELAAGDPFQLNLQLSGGPTAVYGTVHANAGVVNFILAEDFEGVTPPALPAGFTASNGAGDPVLWRTTAGSPLVSNSLFVDNPAVASDKRLDLPQVTINSGKLTLSFDHEFNLENTFDGGVLEISIDGGAFEDVLDIGGTFASGGYNSIISSDFNSPLGGRPAWSGDLFGSAAHTSLIVQMGAGSDVIVRLRMASDSVGAATGDPAGWWVDNIQIGDGGAVCAPVGTGLDVDSHAIAGSSSNLNITLEPGEDVLIGSFQVNGTPNPLPLTGTVSNFFGPVGATYVIVDSTANYGSIPGNLVAAPESTGDCFAATGDCYVLGLSNPVPRPAAHWDATFDESLSSGGSKTWTLHVGGSFPDVPTNNPFYRFIETIFHNSITGGCLVPGSYCPGDATLRKQMAVFVLKAVEGAAYLPPAATGVFNDVPQGDPFAPWIEELYRRGVVAGCATPNGPNYCPNDPVLRQQMAVFLLRTKLGSGYVPPPCQNFFGDVTCPSPFAAWIEDLFNRSITSGCQASPPLYCPGNAVTRGQMAVFVTKTFGLLLYGP